jgi:hypothetical protein
MKFLPKNDIEKQKLLVEAISKFAKDKEYSSSEINEILQTLETEDPILFRRELVNFGYLFLDPYKNKYRVMKYSPTKADLIKIEERENKMGRFK